MSLNGLDAAAVVEAYQAALAEAGGWQVASIVLRVDLEADNSSPTGSCSNMQVETRSGCWREAQEALVRQGWQ